MKNSNNKIILVIVLLAVIVAGIFLSQKSSKQHAPSNPADVACTTEAKLCPNGSYVSRTGPDCQFATCPESPTAPIDTTAWKTMMTSGVTFKYPTTLGTTYINTSAWPPKVQVIAGPFSCTNADEANAPAGKTTQETINGRSYCVTIESEGAAGSVYNQYAYAYSTQGKVLYFTFTLRQPQCDNYDDPQKTACQSEESTFNVDNLMDTIIQTATL